MIELLLGVALAASVPLAVGLVAHDLAWQSRSPRSSWIVLALLVVAPAIVALALPRKPTVALLVVPWLSFTALLALLAISRLVARMLRDPRATPAWLVGLAAAAGFLAVGATWLVIDRAGLQPFGFARTIVLLTAVHFHVAGFVLTLAGSLAARRRPGPATTVPLFALILGTPLTALGFFGLPLVSWVGALTVAAAGIGIGLATLRAARAEPGRAARAALGVGGATLFVTMPLAAAFATGTTFGIPFLDIPAMAAVHGGLNVVGFAIPTMFGWHRSES
jgi:YndJ-like protein